MRTKYGLRGRRVTKARRPPRFGDASPPRHRTSRDWSSEADRSRSRDRFGSQPPGARRTAPLEPWRKGSDAGAEETTREDAGGRPDEGGQKDE